MNQTVDALKALYAALGGKSTDDADITLIPDIVNAIATLVQSGGTAELPSVKSTDNGKVLTVVSGKWAAANLPG